MSVSTHVLDTFRGLPAAGMPVALFARDGEDVREIARGVTDGDGRCPALLHSGQELLPGVYGLRFDVAAYFRAQGIASLYPQVEIAFLVESTVQRFHLPLLLAPNGYTTYRGS